MSSSTTVFVVTILSALCGFSAGLNCSQCNNRFGGIPNTCVSPRNLTGCMGCLKTLTKVKIRDSGYINGWERLSVVVSRVCMRPGSTYIKPEGCYRQQNNGGYTERCFCYTDYCNSRASRTTAGFLAPLLSSSSLLAVLTTWWIIAGTARTGGL